MSLFKSNKKTRVKIFLSFLVALIAVSPHVFAYFVTPKGYYFGGFNILSNLIDVQGAYFPAIRNFALGDWLFRNQFNPEMKPVFLYAVYLVLGKIVAISRLPVWVVYVCSMFILAFPFCFLVFRFLEKIFGDFKKELFVFGLVIFGGFMTAGSPEAAGIFTLQFPHFIVSVFSVFFFFYNLYVLDSGNYKFRIISIFLSAVLISITHPWIMVFLFTFTLLWAVYLFFSKENWGRVIPVLVISLAAGGPFLVYYATGNRIPWVGYALPFGIVPLLLMLGPEVPFFIYGFLTQFRKYPFFAIWFLVQLLFVFFPLPFARRFLEGIYFPVAFFCFLGFSEIIEKLTKGKDTFSNYLLVPCYLTVGVVGVFFWSFFWIPNTSVYRSMYEKEAYSFLSNTVQRYQRILTMGNTGNVMVGEVDANFFIGHPIETNEYAEKLKFVRDFYSTKNAELWREQLLLGDICYVYDGPSEKKLGGNIEAQYMQRIFSNDKVEIYKTNWCK